MGNTSSKNDVSSDTTDVSSLASHIDDIAKGWIFVSIFGFGVTVLLKVNQWVIFMGSLQQY
jgi:hypothetical protein